MARSVKKSPRKKPPSTPLSREKILDVSERIVAEVGIEGFSMRRLARELGTTPMSLYWHFENKVDVVNELVRRLFSRIELPIRGSGDWRSATMVTFTALYDEMVRRPTIITAIGPARAPKEALIWANEVIALLLESGFDERQAAFSFNLLMRYTVSSAQIASRPGDAAATREGTLEDLPEESAAIWSRVQRYFSRDADSMKEELRFGLERILDGIESCTDA